MTSLVDISGMFSYCFNLTSINLGFLENATKVQNLFNMFYYCHNLIEIEFRNFGKKIYLKDISII